MTGWEWVEFLFLAIQRYSESYYGASGQAMIDILLQLLLRPSFAILNPDKVLRFL